MQSILIFLIFPLFLFPLLTHAQSELGQVKETLKLQEQLSTDTRIADYFEKLKANPLDPQVHFDLGEIYLDRSLNELAISSYRRAIQLRSNYGQAYVGLSKALRKKGLKTLELQAMEKGVEVMPEDPTLRLKLGTLYMEPAFYNYDKAKNQYKSLKKMNSPLALDLAKILGIETE